MPATKKPRVYSERQFQKEIIKLNKDENWGWYIYSIPDSRWATAKGYPDLTLLHVEYDIIFVAELKAAKGRLKPEQHIWLAHLSKKMPAHIWYPKDLPKIKHMLSTGDLVNDLAYEVLFSKQDVLIMPP